MIEAEAKALKVEDRVIFRFEGTNYTKGTVTRTWHAAFEIEWDDGTLQRPSYNEAHYIFKLEQPQ